ncbi:hypothetical protein [Streptomyces sp. NPDC048737]|uniref:hypothetical protein n=1 Tax=unclassified Streptomyces TaxID=2593676 RepID=UPI0034332986
MPLFLDVDGPLIPFGGPDPYPRYGGRAVSRTSSPRLVVGHAAILPVGGAGW